MDSVEDDRFYPTETEVTSFVQNVNPKDNYYTKRVVFISNIKHGPPKQYADDLSFRFPLVNFISIRSRSELLALAIRKEDIVFVNHLVHTDIVVDDILQVQNETGPLIFISVYDTFWIDKFETQLSDSPVSSLHPKLLRLFFACNMIIYHSNHIQHLYARYLSVPSSVSCKNSKTQDLNMFNTIFQSYHDKENLVIITSKIHVSQYPLSYSSSRSRFNSRERFNQTLETIESIRKYIPGSYITFFDNSKSIPKESLQILRNRVDVFLTASSKQLDYFTDINDYKAFAELAQLITAYNMFLSRIKSDYFKNIFKLSARYTVMDTFNISKFTENFDDHKFKRDSNLQNMKWYYTSFYRIAPRKFHAFFSMIKNLFLNRKFYLENNLPSLEEMIPHALNYSFIELSTLGIRQNVAVFDIMNSI